MSFDDLSRQMRFFGSVRFIAHHGIDRRATDTTCALVSLSKSTKRFLIVVHRVSTKRRRETTTPYCSTCPFPQTQRRFCAFFTESSAGGDFSFPRSDAHATLIDCKQPPSHQVVLSPSNRRFGHQHAFKRKMFAHSASETKPCFQNNSMSALVHLSVLCLSLLAVHASHGSQGAENTKSRSKHPYAAEYDERVVRETAAAIYQATAVSCKPPRFFPVLPRCEIPNTCCSTAVVIGLFSRHSSNL